MGKVRFPWFCFNWLRIVTGLKKHPINFLYVVIIVDGRSALVRQFATSQHLLSVGLPPHVSSSTLNFLGIGPEKLIWFPRMGTCDVVEGSRRDVVRFAFPNRRVILK